MGGGINSTNFGNKSFHVDFNWRLNVLTDEAVTIDAGNRNQNLTIFAEKDVFLRRDRLGPCMHLKAWPHSLN